jgi:3-dehydroquinate synthase
MLVASALSKKLGYINDSIKQRIENLIKSVGLPTRIKNIPLHRVIKAHYQDKKFKGAKNRFVLIQGIGKTRITEDVPLSLIKETIKNYSS